MNAKNVLLNAICMSPRLYHKYGPRKCLKRENDLIHIWYLRVYLSQVGASEYDYSSSKNKGPSNRPPK
jgi:hypothetical protein